MIRLFKLCAEQSRILLITGLLAGIGLPGLATAMAPYLPEMVAILLVITAFRIGHRNAFGALSDLRWSLPAVLVLQVALPLSLAGLLWAAGVIQTPLALALLLATSAPTLSGGASLAIILRQDPARMMQILILGTAVFPLTILVVFTLVPIVSAQAELIAVGFRALAVILGAAAVGFALRARLLPKPTEAETRAIDGAAVLFFSVIVIGLMAGLGPVMREAPMDALLWLIAAFVLSFGVQALTVALLSKSALAHVTGPLALSAGNRNIALFLVALPAEVVAPVMVFVACWQVPMYLTPILLKRLYAIASGAS